MSSDVDALASAAAPIALWYAVLPDWCREKGVSQRGRGQGPGNGQGKSPGRDFFEAPVEAQKQLQKGIAALPQSMAEGLRSYVQAADQARGLALRLLVRKALRALPSPEGENAENAMADTKAASMPDPLEAWAQDQHGWPSIPHMPRFNATHSGHLVALALRERPPGNGPQSDAGLGLDAEAYRNVDFRLMEHYMRPTEWVDIQTHAQPRRRFFHFWTAKEALMKAEGLGFHLPLEDIELKGDFARIRGRSWHLHRPPLPAHLEQEYALHLACAEPDPQWRIQGIDWPDLLGA